MIGANIFEIYWRRSSHWGRDSSLVKQPQVGPTPWIYKVFKERETLWLSNFGIRKKKKKASLKVQQEVLPHLYIASKLECSFCWVACLANHMADMLANTEPSIWNVLCSAFSTYPGINFVVVPLSVVQLLLIFRIVAFHAFDHNYLTAYRERFLELLCDYQFHGDEMFVSNKIQYTCSIRRWWKQISWGFNTLEVWPKW